MLAAHADGVAGTAGRGRSVLRRERRGGLRLWPFLGPAFIACVAYIDPGNFATNIAGGSKFGYRLVWVIVAANLLAMLIQTLSAKLGIATQRNLPEVCRERLPRPASFFLWLQAEAIAMATDLAEFLGAAIGLHLLTGLGLFPSAVVSGVASIAGLINVAMLVMAASTFFRSGLHDVDSLEIAHRTLQPIVGGASSALFALALIASGFSSSAVGTLSGQVVMQGFIRRQIPVQLRRLVTMIPAFVVIAIGVDPSRTLVISQVVLSFGIPFALVPLVLFTAQRDVMGPLVNRRLTTIVACAVVAVIVALNVFLLYRTFAA